VRAGWQATDGPDGDPWRRIYLAGGRDGGWASGWAPGRPNWGPPRAHGARTPLSLLGLALLAVQLIGSTVAGRHQPGARPLDGSGYLLLVLGPLAWLFLRRRPLVVSVVAVGAAATYLGLGYPMGPVVASAGLALLSAVARGRRWGAWIVGAIGYAALLGLGEVSGHPVAVGRAVAVAAWLVLLLVVGEAPRYRAQQFAAARRARAAETRVAASAERLALARDLHDTIGHSLSMIAVQAGVALHLLDEHPEQARPALTAIRTASKEALEEVRATLSILREEDFEGRPAPGLGRVGDLVAAARVGGLAVHIEPEPLGDSVSRLPDDVDAAAFRVVQEGLTNVARHSAAANATVSIVRSPSSLEVSVVDDGLGADQVVEGGGLRGMRERAAALGGQVDAGPVEGGGFRVAVRFPLDNKTTAP
jgi:signal transduction histidine kinase